MRDLENLSREEEHEIYRGFKDEESLVDGYPYVELVDEDIFWDREGWQDEVTKWSPSFWRRVYHTLF